jgi:hypothetical protein
MLRMILVSTAATALISAPAMAETAKPADKPQAEAPSASAAKAKNPKIMTDEQMDTVVAGAIFVQTQSGNTVWTVTDLAAAEGYNPGGKGNTANAAPGLLTAVGAGGLTLLVE